MPTQKYINDITYQIISCAIEVNKILGPGLLESVYQACFVQEMRERGLDVKEQINVPIVYKGTKLAQPLRLDILVEDIVIVELKAVDIMLPIFQAQLLSYLRLSNKPKGLLINFNTINIAKTLMSFVNESFAELDRE